MENIAAAKFEVTQCVWYRSIRIGPALGLNYIRLQSNIAISPWLIRCSKLDI